ncbi:MAG: hypothetical protein J6Y25_02750 [Elusimicrobiaceae bacterium]|nr:hypothetical protein [Elusimicrobiaceae bacterium]
MSEENIDKNVIGFPSNTQRWGIDENATLETLVQKIISKKYLPTNMDFADGWTLYINNKPIFYISKSLNKVDYYFDKNQLLSQFINTGSVIYLKFVIKTNEAYNTLKLNADKKAEIHKLELEKLKSAYTTEYKESGIEKIYNKIIELYYTNDFFENLSEIIYAFSGALANKTQINVEEYLDDMLEGLYFIVLEENKFNKLIQEKYSWLSIENRKLIHLKLSYNANK